MNQNSKTAIEIQKGHEYHVFIDNRKNIYEQNRFFYPVYHKSIELVKEIHFNSVKSKNSNQISTNLHGEPNEKDFSNNIIMYCAERGGGKSSAMRTFANLLENFEDEKNNESTFPKEWGTMFSKCHFSVLKPIDPTAISDKDLFMRLILSRMFASLRQKWEKDSNNSYNYTNKNHDDIVKKFMECYRYLDVIYQKGSEFKCDDDLECLTDLGDSGQLKSAFGSLVKYYLQEMIGFIHEDNYLVIQVDDADLNSRMAYDIIEDIRKYCIIPNVIVLMAVDMKQMQQVVEQHFITDFQILLNASKERIENDRSIDLSDCQRMAIRYIDKIMPASHQIHLPTIDTFIRNNHSELSIRYIDTDENRNLLDFKDINGEEILDYQEVLIRLIYNKTGIALVKADSYVHNILPKTMRGISHFMAYICPLEDLDCNVGIAEINALVNSSLYENVIGIKKSEAENELHKRLNNLNVLEQYFLKNWCTIRLEKRYQRVIDDIANTVSEQKIPIAVKLIAKLFPGLKSEDSKERYPSKLSSMSYAYLLEQLRLLTEYAKSSETPGSVYKFAYAIRFYFMLFYNKTVLNCIKQDKEFKRLYRLTNLELWEPYHQIMPNLTFNHFDIDYNKLMRLCPNVSISNYSDSFEGETRIAENTIVENLLININESNYFLNLNNNEIQEELINKRENKNYDLQIMYDLSAVLMSYACDKPQINDKEDSRNTLRLANCLFSLLLNWDIQRYAEKTPNLKDVRIKQHEIMSLADITNDYLKTIFAHMGNITYLPLQWNENYNLIWLKDILDIVQYTNKTNAIDFARACTDKMSSLVKELSDKIMSYTIDNIEEAYIEQIATAPEIKEIQIIASNLEPFSKISNKLSDIVNGLNNRWRAFRDEYTQLTKVFKLENEKVFELENDNDDKVKFLFEVLSKAKISYKEYERFFNKNSSQINKLIEKAFSNS